MFGLLAVSNLAGSQTIYISLLSCDIIIKFLFIIISTIVITNHINTTTIFYVYYIISVR